MIVRGFMEEELTSLVIDDQTAGKCVARSPLFLHYRSFSYYVET
jgi:hypothetical protein